jgi:hypothetical protein
MTLDAECHFSILLSVVMLNVVTLSVVAPNPMCLYAVKKLDLFC